MLTASIGEQNSPITCRSQESEKPRPPQKPLPADPLGRTPRLGRGTSAIGGCVSSPVPVPSVPRPVPPVPQPVR